VSLGSALLTGAGGAMTTGAGWTTTLGVSGTYVVSVLTSRLAHPTPNAAVKMTAVVKLPRIKDFIRVLLFSFQIPEVWSKPLGNFLDYGSTVL
jgi:hypothetical protein